MVLRQHKSNKIYEEIKKKNKQMLNLGRQVVNEKTCVMLKQLKTIIKIWKNGRRLNTSRLLFVLSKSKLCKYFSILVGN